MATFTAATGFCDTTGGDETQTITPNLSDLILLVLGTTGSTTDPVPFDNNPDGLGGAGTWYKAISTVKSASADKLSLFVRNGLIGSAVSTIFDGGLPASTGSIIYVIQIAGMTKAGASAIRSILGVPQVGGENNTTPPPQPQLPANSLTANLLVSAVMDVTNPGGCTAPSGFTRQVNDGMNVPTTGINIATADNGQTTNSFLWGSGSNPLCDWVAELDASSNFVPNAADTPFTFGGRGAGW